VVFNLKSVGCRVSWLFFKARATIIPHHFYSSAVRFSGLTEKINVNGSCHP